MIVDLKEVTWTGFTAVVNKKTVRLANRNGNVEVSNEHEQQFYLPYRFVMNYLESVNSGDERKQCLYRISSTVRSAWRILDQIHNHYDSEDTEKIVLMTVYRSLCQRKWFHGSSSTDTVFYNIGKLQPFMKTKGGINYCLKIQLFLLDKGMQENRNG